MNRWLWVMIVCGVGVVLLLLGLQLSHERKDDQLPQVMSPPPQTPAASKPLPLVDDRNPQEPAQQILAHRDALDHTVWSKEMSAQEYEDTFVAMWDAMRARLDDQYVILANCPFDDLELGTFGPASAHERDIRSSKMVQPSRHLNSDSWKTLLSSLNEQGYRLEHSEWHHAAFSPAVDAHGMTTSQVNMKLFVVNEHLRQKIVINGPLTIDWGTGRDSQGHHLISHIDASHLSMTSRIGADGFSESFHFMPESRGIDPQITLDPVLVYDVNGDGKPDILLPSINTLLLNRSTPGHMTFDTMDLCTHPIGQTSMETGPYVTAAIVGNFLGRGQPDLLECGPSLVPTIYPGNGGGQYTEFGEPVTTLPPNIFSLPMCITAGDIRGNGALDVWIGQYRRPYADGNFPVPYWDANDGYPSFLCMNDGYGHFTDTTSGSGLDAKRLRRNFSASLLDLNGDGKLDLITVNDFSGVDLFLGKGDGTFTDATSSMIDQRALFGMSHAIADIDGDGKLDVFIAGMGSTTARRLDQMKLGRAEYPDQQRMRMPMAYGNRLLLGTSDHRLRQAPYNDTIARTGWTWGTAVIDPDNSGRLDVYLSNGNLSGSTAKDYCTRFWTQDIYMGSSEPSKQWSDFFQIENNRLKGYSWNPFEHKALLMNEGAGNFRDTAYLMNVGFEYDARQALAVDFDGDGHTDLLEVELRPSSKPGGFTRPVLHIYHNQMADHHHWLEVLVPDAPHLSPLGATIVVSAGGKDRIAALVAGDSYRSQHPPSAHFGLGDLEHVDSVTVKWTTGKSKIIMQPQVDALLTVRP
jgi:hypothetical protein